MEIDVALARGLTEFGTAVAGVRGSEWGHPTPCPDWTARQVVRHCTSVQRRTAAILRGEVQPKIEAPTDDAGDPAPAWTAVEAEMRDALVVGDLGGIVVTSGGPMPVATAVSFPAIDLFVHAWDLGRATARPVELADDVVAWIQGIMRSTPPEKFRNARGFGPARPAPVDASPTATLMAFLGREVAPI